LASTQQILASQVAQVAALIGQLGHTHHLDVVGELLLPPNAAGNRDPFARRGQEFHQGIGHLSGEF
jgi:hypothetical protein